jgi:hypothetical protein
MLWEFVDIKCYCIGHRGLLELKLLKINWGGTPVYIVTYYWDLICYGNPIYVEFGPHLICI